MSREDSKSGDSPAIPTYDEAIASRPHSARLFQGPQEISDDAERQGLLPEDAPPNRQQQWHGASRYESVPAHGRSSEDSVDFLSAEDGEDGGRGLRREMEQMEVMDGGGPSNGLSRMPRRMLPELSKRIAGMRESLSAFRLPAVRIPFSGALTPFLFHIKPGYSLLLRVFVLLMVMALMYGLVVLRVVTWKVIPPGQQFVPESLRGFVQGSVDPDIIRGYLYEVTYDDHVAGTKGDFFLAEWVHDRFVDAGLEDVHYDDYSVYLNYPRADGRRVAIVSPPELAWDAKLEEDVIQGKEGQHQVLAFHGLSKSGNVTGPLIYANYGAKEDFDYLEDQGIEVLGAIVLVKYQGTQGDRAQKVKAAELAGAAGCLIYSDPKDDGFLKGKPWPDGPWRTSDSIERGSVALSSWTVGDVLTPGWASLPDAERNSIEDAPALVKIPSLPLAWRDAQVLLQSLADHGIQVPDDWIGGVPDVEAWWTGSLAHSPMVNLMNIQDESVKQPIRNVLGRIEGGEDPQKIVYVGNHRDAWCFGASDPGSGTAVMLEVVRIFGDLVDHGWKPRRTIVFASWDAEEYNLIGSTEHVENYMDDIRANAVAYLNVDGAVAGEGFRAAGNPSFGNLLMHTLHRIEDPAGNGSLFDAWNASSSRLEGLGAGSDYVAFQDLAGCSSLDFGFGGPKGFPFAQYHSCYENFDWMEKFGDPGFVYHAALAQIWGLLLLELADEPILPLDLIAYSREVARYVADLKHEAEAASSPRDEGDDVTPQSNLDTTALEEAAQLFLKTASAFVNFEGQWAQEITEHNMNENRETAAIRMSHNARTSSFDTHLLDLPPANEGRVGGVPGREQFKHVIYGPQKWSGYDEEVFPAIRDAMADGDWDGAQTQLDIVAKTLKHAAWKLVQN